MAMTRFSRRAVLFGTAGVAAATVGVAVWRRIPPTYEGGSLSVSQAHDAAISGDVILIDIRTPREWMQTGIGAGALPLDMRRGDFISALGRIAGNDQARPIALICARGVRSARMSLQLANAGFTRVIDVPEGMLGSRAGPGWLAAGLPVTDWNGEQA